MSVESLIENQRRFETQRRQDRNFFCNNITVNSGQITDEPIESNDLVNKAYVDSSITLSLDELTSVNVDELKSQVDELQKFKSRYEDLCEFLLAQHSWLDKLILKLIISKAIISLIISIFSLYISK